MKATVVKIKKVLSLVLVGMLALSMTGCIKVQTSVEVKADGSGTLGIAFGMTQQARALLSSQGEDPMASFTEMLNKSGSAAPEAGLKATKWAEGEYEWSKVEKAFRDLEELNTIMAEYELFENFTIVRNKGLFRDQFVLKGRLVPFPADETSTANTTVPVDPTGFIEVQVAVKLPGKITAANGTVNINDPNQAMWYMAKDQAVDLEASSMAWNWLNLALIGGLAGILVLVAAVVAGLALVRSMRRKEPPAGQDIDIP